VSRRSERLGRRRRFWGVPVLTSWVKAEAGLSFHMVSAGQGQAPPLFPRFTELFWLFWQF